MSEGTAAPATLSDRVKRWLASVGDFAHGGPVEAGDLTELETKLYFDLEKTRDPYVRFAVLLVLSVIIATGGVLVDSTATVIGAMIVAPLMTPIMAGALAMVTGDGRHLVRSLLLVAIGVLTAVGLSLAMGWLSIVTPDPATNAQMVGRTSPRTMDLIVALASGAAGAFALSRRSVADALPGVAIAISLVPPLCVVGVSLSVGDVDAAGGAFLLFGTNFLAILAAGGAVLAVMGYGAVRRQGVGPNTRRRAAIVTAVALVLLLVPLATTSLRVARDSVLEVQTRAFCQQWLVGSNYDLLQVTATGDVVTITISGVGPLPPTATLKAQVEAKQPGVRTVLRVLAGEQIELDPG